MFGFRLVAFVKAFLASRCYAPVISDVDGGISENAI